MCLPASTREEIDAPLPKMVCSLTVSKTRKKRTTPGADARKGKTVAAGGQQSGEPPGLARDAGPGYKNYYNWIFLAVLLLFVIVVRARLLGFPLERDEGEYAYLGQLIQQGIPPYAIAYNMKLPGTYFMYALIMSLCGQTVTGVHLGLMVMNCLTILLVYKIGAKMVSPLAGCIAACAYALLSLDPSVLGFAGHATHFVVFWAMAGLLVLLYAFEKDRLRLYFAAGVLLSLAFIMKQQGIFLLFFGAAYIVLHGLQAGGGTKKRMLLSLAVFLSGVLSILFVMVIYLAVTGVLEKFWFFTFVYSFSYATQVPLSLAPRYFTATFSGILGGFSIIWLFAGLGLIALFLHPGLREKRWPISLFAVCSFLSVCPGFYFREHYFVTLLPAVSLLAGIFIDYLHVESAKLKAPSLSFLGKGLPAYVALAVFAPAVIAGAAHRRAYLFGEDPAVLCRAIYGINPFPESVEVSRFIERNTSAADRIAVLGSEPEIYFYSGRRAATGHIYTYGLMEAHPYSLAMQKEMAAEIERSGPKFVVFVRVDLSWLPRPESERYIFRWASAYLRDRYDIVGIADIAPPDDTIYKWYDDARNYTPRSTAKLVVFQRRPNPPIS